MQKAAQFEAQIEKQTEEGVASLNEKGEQLRKEVDDHFQLVGEHLRKGSQE